MLDCCGEGVLDVADAIDTMEGLGQPRRQSCYILQTWWLPKEMLIHSFVPSCVKDNDFALSWKKTEVVISFNDNILKKTKNPGQPGVREAVSIYHRSLMVYNSDIK